MNSIEIQGIRTDTAEWEIWWTTDVIRTNHSSWDVWKIHVLVKAYR